MSVFGMSNKLNYFIGKKLVFERIYKKQMLILLVTVLQSVGMNLYFSVLPVDVKKLLAHYCDQHRGLVNEALIKGNREDVQICLSLNPPNREGLKKLLVDAAAQGNTQAVMVFLELEVDPNSYELWEKTPLRASVESGKCELVELLLKAGAKANLKIDESVNGIFHRHLSPLSGAVLRGNGNLVELLLKYGGDPNEKDQQERNLLCLAAQAMAQRYYYGFQNDDPQSYLKICELLVSKGCDINYSSPIPDTISISAKSHRHLGANALHQAVFDGNLQLIELLLKLGADSHRWGCYFNPVNWRVEYGTAFNICEIFERSRRDDSREAILLKNKILSLLKKNN